MRVAAPAAALHAALSRVGKVIASRNVIPVLACVHVVADDDGLRVTASSYEMTMTARVSGAEVEEPGAACIPADELMRFAKLAGKTAVAIEAAEKSAVVTWGRARAELLTLPAGDFPSLIDYAGLEMQDVDGDLLSKSLRFASVAMSRDETRYQCNGIYLSALDGGSVAVGTDGHRLHRAIMPACPIAGGAIIPAAHVSPLAEIAGSGGRVRFGLGPTHWVVATEDVRARGSVVDASFPDYERVITKDPELVAIADREALIGAIEVALTGTENRSKLVTIDIQGDEISARGLNPASTMAKGASAAIDAEIRAPVLSAFNGAYLQDCLRVHDCDQVATFTASDGLILHFEPREQAPDLRLLSLVMGVRASPQEMAA